MKTCGDCKQTKELSAFNKKGNGHQSRCRECQRTWYAAYYNTSEKEKERLAVKRNAEMQAKRQVIKQAKDMPCMDCGVEYPSYVMDFDHRDPSKKSFNIAAQLPRINMAKLLEEIKKCDVVCANCHRIRTYCSLV